MRTPHVHSPCRLIVKGDGTETIVELEKGQWIMFNSAVYHFGCSTFDMAEHGNLPRRRLFMYFDHAVITDSGGSVVTLNEAPLKEDYNVRFFDGLTSLMHANFVMHAEMNYGRQMISAHLHTGVVMGGNHKRKKAKHT